MRAMVEPRGLARHAAPAGILLVFSSGLALYQLTSLALGPAASRQIDLSVSIPGVEMADPPAFLPLGADLVLGTRATTTLDVAMPPPRVAATPRALVARTPAAAGRPTPAPLPTARKHHEPD
jgi:hypothetical protein